ncbi:aminotransferase class I/II-fold pyridoxal phosphate-dependent enzyme [Paraburkholderia tropica]|uniref:aminotransferase class I/II-fold pyridoxal phosphate-dependent enzyme n=1 Tax=Paraburkholderia tropica TaxID=92647 RepID=UPI001F2F7F4D|nr:aminotransferase class I/II-fold pyridoxal phosphate-dependent enzyme [Paraburkholderia tropica]
MNFLSDRINRIKPSPSMAAKALVDKLRAEGRDIVDFTIGEPDLKTPDNVLEAAITALRNGETKYTGSNGTPRLRKAIADKLARDNQLSYTPENVVVGSGGKHIIFHALAVTLNPGDEVIIHAPYWVSYPDMVVVNDGVPVIVQGSEAEGFKLSPAALEAAITPRTKWLILNSPNNPTGAVYTAGELAALGEVLKRHPHVWLMSDEIYEHFVYDGAHHVSAVQAIPAIAGRCLVVNGASKGYSMTGFRVGFGAGPLTLVNAIAKLISQTTTCPSSISQAAAIEAFSGSQDAPRAAARSYAARGKLMAELLGNARRLAVHAPRGAFYLYPCVAGLIGRTTPAGDVLTSDVDVVRYFTECAGVATLDGSAYGVSPYLRLSFATSEQNIREGCRRIVEACAALT